MNYSGKKKNNIYLIFSHYKKDEFKIDQFYFLNFY